MTTPARKLLLLSLLLSLGHVVSAAPMRYHGQLSDGGRPANGRYDLQISLYSSAEAGTPLDYPTTLEDVEVVDGQFQVELDAPPAAQNSPAWLQAAVRDGASNGAFNEIAGREKVTLAPLIGACWDTTGNSGINAATEFIGTTDLNDLVLRSGNIQVGRFSAVNGLEVGNVIFGRQNFERGGVRGAVVAGGGSSFVGNVVTDDFGVIGGGSGNMAGDDSPIGVDLPGPQSATYATVSGGGGNQASGNFSSVAGGSKNCAGGDYSWAGGRRAKVRRNSLLDPTITGCSNVASTNTVTGDQGSFVWADSQDIDFTSTGANQFLLRAQGGMGLNTARLGAAADLRLSEVVIKNGTSGDNTDITLMNDGNRGYNIVSVPGSGGAAGSFSIGEVDARAAAVGFASRLLIAPNGDVSVTANAFKPGGGAWSVASDARLKRDVSRLSGSLDRLLDLHGVSFNYRDDAPKTLTAPGPQIGFIAQDVEKVFPQWISEVDGYKTISIKGFEAMVVEALRELRSESAIIDSTQAETLEGLRAENLALRADNAALKAQDQAIKVRLDALEARLK